jgi:O-Antigen ligase
VTALATHNAPTPGLGRYVAPVLVAACGAIIIALTALLLLDGPPLLTRVLQVLLIAGFLGLALLDLRAAVAIAMLELAVAGASGQWTRFPGGISGRVALDLIVAFAGAVWLIRDWRLTGRLELGRYGLHALAIGVTLPLIWMPLGLLNGNLPSDVVADGNGHLFLAFSLAIIALIRQGHGAWVRNWFLVVCIVNAVVTLAMIAGVLLGIIPLRPLADILYGDLLAGNVIGFQPNGAFRFFLASGLYLQIGIALVAWRIMRNPTSILNWAMYAILLIDVTATYTRGFWIGSVVALGAVLLLGAASWRPPAIVLGGTAAIFLAGTVISTPFNFSLPDYIYERAMSITSTGDETPTTTDPGGGGGAAEPGGIAYDRSGARSNQIRVHQAEVLIGHIIERPILGHGFGTIAQDYQFDKIFSYELAFLDLMYKTGIVGLLIYVSFPVRLIIDALRARIGRLRIPQGVGRRETAIVVSIVTSILLTGATNPYFLSAFGLMPIIVMIAWLDPLPPIVDSGSRQDPA